MKRIALLLGVALAALPAVASAKTYTVETGFSSGDGSFTFGSGTGGSTFTPFTTTYSGNCFGAASIACKSSSTNSDVPVAGLNTATTPTAFVGTVLVPGGALFLHPGNSDAADAIINFVAPTTTTYTFSGAFTRYSTANNGTGVNVSVFGNGNTLASDTIGSAAYGASSEFGGSIRLNAGDLLTFAVNRNGEYQYDSTGLSASISTVPEPAVWGMMIMGMGAVGASLRRRKSVARAAFA